MNPHATVLSRVLSIMVGVWVGFMLGPLVFTFLFFFLFLIGIPVGLVLGPIIGGIWGNQTPLFRTAFGAFGVWLGILIFVLGEKFLELPTRAVTWFAAPVLGLAALWLLPKLAKRLLPEAKRESAAIIAAVLFLAAPLALTPLLHFFPDLLPKDQIEIDNESAAKESDFVQKADAAALAGLPQAQQSHLPLVTEKILFLRRNVPEVCCPGVRAPALRQEAGAGNWHIAMHYLTTATPDSTVRYYEQILGGKAVKLPQDSSLTAWQVKGAVRGVAVTARVVEVPQRGVCVVIF